MIIKVNRQDRALNRVYCPFCEGVNIIGNDSKDEVELPPEKDYCGYPIKQIAYKTMLNRTCKNCNRVFTLNFGISKYSVFERPLGQTNTSDIALLAEYKSECFENYCLYMAVNPNGKPKYYYYIFGESLRHPIFLTRKQAFEFLNDHKRTIGFIRRVGMTRYR